MVDFESAFKYPFNRAKGMWNILWAFLPIFGWFALGGYGVRIVKEFTSGKFKQLPVMKFGSDMKLGFFMFLKAIPFIVAYLLLLAIFDLFGAVGMTLMFLIELLVFPILTINFMKKQTMESLFELGIVSAVFNNLGDYVIAILKSIGLVLVFLVLCVVLVGFPAMIFTQNIFLADFYRRNVK